MATKYLLFIGLFSGVFLGFMPRSNAQKPDSQIFVNVNLVQLNVAVTDRKGNYVTNLRPEDFAITEDVVPEKIATFEEGNEPTLRLADFVRSGVKPMIPGAGPSPGLAVAGFTSTGAQAAIAGARQSQYALDPAQALGSKISGANVFILFDTSNYMYRGFVFAQDAIADFVRSLQSASKVALYSYSRDLSRVTTLTSDRPQVLRGVRSTVAGDDAALYNSLLLTVRDAARVTGRKVIVVFSNGPDDASEVPPEDVAELAQSTGTIIYMISTHAAQLEPISTAVFERMSKATGGKAYFARSWKDEARAFASIRDDLEHLYSLSYYPQPNPNQGWRKITVKLVGNNLHKYRVRTRAGYRLQEATVSLEDAWDSGSDPLAK